MSKRHRLQNEYENIKDIKKKVLITAIKRPSGAIETIINHDDLKTKIEYILNNYDEELRLKSKNDIQILDFILV